MEALEKELQEIKSLMMLQGDWLIVPKFINMCKNAKTVEDLLALVDMGIKYTGSNGFFKGGLFFKLIYNMCIGWAIPSPQALDIIAGTFKQHLERYPNARLIDVGAGTGLYSALLTHPVEGRFCIPKEKMIALDVDPKTFGTTKEFYHITLVKQGEEFTINPEDAILIAWGSGCGAVVDRYEKDGGTCIIIQGEGDGGCTYSTDTFQNSKDWKYKCDGPLPSFASIYMENISVSTRYP